MANEHAEAKLRELLNGVEQVTEQAISMLPTALDNMAPTEALALVQIIMLGGQIGAQFAKAAAQGGNNAAM